MNRVISASRLRTELSQLLDQLDNGATHFIIERNNQASAVLLSIEKFRDIMQTLEMLNALEFIGSNSPNLDEESDGYPTFPTQPGQQPVFSSSQITTNQGEDGEAEGEDSPSLVSLPGNPDKERQNKGSRSESIEEAAAKLGIRLIK